jgi:hypothetical protein
MTAPAAEQRCRALAEAAAAGAALGAAMPPLTQEQADLIDGLLSDPPYVLDGAAWPEKTPPLRVHEEAAGVDDTPLQDRRKKAIEG